MNIESRDLIASLERMKFTGNKPDLISITFDRGIETAIQLIKIYEDQYMLGLALQNKEKGK